MLDSFVFQVYSMTKIKLIAFNSIESRVMIELHDISDTAINCFL